MDRSHSDNATAVRILDDPEAEPRALYASTAPARPDRPPPIPAITGLRFFAALYVVVFHFGLQFTSPDSFAGRVLECGYTAVALFFVLSGFVLSYNYVDGSGAFTTSSRKFWSARFARIYPVHFIAFLLAAPYIIAGSIAANTAIVAAAKLGVGAVTTVLLVQAWYPKSALYWNAPAWSISVEAVFYFLFPFVAAGVGRVRGRRLLWAMLGLWILGLVPSIVYGVLRPDGLDTVSRETAVTWLAVLKYNPVLRLPEFLLGVALGRYFRLGVGKPRISGDVWCALGLVGMFVSYYFYRSIPFPLLHNAFLAPFFAALVYGLASGGVLSKILSRPSLVLLGEASYSTYILQVPVWTYMVYVFPKAAFDVDARGVMFLVGYIVLLVILSVLSLWYIEQPARDRLKALTGRRRTAAAA